MQENPDPNVAFTVLVKREGEDDNDSPSNGDDGLVNVAHEVVSEAVQTVRPNRAAPLFKDNTIGYEPSCLNTIATYFKVKLCISWRSDCYLMDIKRLLKREEALRGNLKP